MFNEGAFDDIEFYLPQIAHLIVHLDDSEVCVALDRLVVILCQVSFHTALLLRFMFLASFEDYQGEACTT